MYKYYFKRVIDFVTSLILIILMIPCLILISFAIFIDDPGEIFFSQKRIGINKSTFNLYKFRSMKMTTPHDTPTHLLKNPDMYITKIGKFLRSTSLDELPQLLNILLGQMSFIGPRPALWNQDDLIRERDKYGANDIRPGLTGWAQVNGRDELQIEEKARLDGEYVSKMSLMFDLKCILLTFKVVFTKEGLKEGGTGGK